MKKKINTYLLLTVILTLMATLITAVAIFHHMYREQVIEDMQTYTNLLESMVSSGEELERNYTSKDPELRVTVVAEDGRVEFDSKAQEMQLGNHAGRPEIQEAMDHGEAYSVRHSDTMDMDMYYYAMKLDSGEILRISREETSIWGMFTSTTNGILSIGFFMFLICLALSWYMTRMIVDPIEKMAENIDSIDEICTYEELVPFITTIHQQHKDIIKGAKMRQEFTANVSHELKTPLTSIYGYAELIETGIAGEENVQRFAKEIHRNAKRLLNLINDIIRLSELDSDQIEVSFTELDLYELSETCVEMLQLSAQQHGMEIACHGTSSMIYANLEMIEELLFNLCDNAIRYNQPGGHVDVYVERKGDTVCLRIKDTGIGIPEESRERVFERFYRVDKSRSKQTGGTGLGLAIVKHIVAQHHAQIMLESEIGRGTEVTVLFGKS